jgi:DNA polymerase-3 subunit delta'
LHLALCGGAPLEAREAATDALQTRRPEFLRSLCETGSDAVALAERFRDLPPTAILSWLQKWTFDLLQMRLAGRVRYHLDLSELARDRAARVDARAMSRLHRRLLAQQRYIRHPLNPRLLIEELLIDCCAVLAGAKDAVT